MTKSICIATYNGGKFLTRQLDSVIAQISEDDEVIIVDDCSTDITVEILSSYNDNRIRVYQNKKNLRHVKAFERALSLSTKDYIFLCDQDDIWVNNRLQIFEKYFIKHQDVRVITSNLSCINDLDIRVENILKKVNADDSFLYKKNILSIFAGRIGYFGCAMAFRRELLDVILPIPDFVEAHDLWIGMVGNLMKTNLHINEVTLHHRLHEHNASDLGRSLREKLKSRMVFLQSYVEISRRLCQ